MHIFGKEMVKSWPEFYADYDGTNSFSKFWDLDQNNPVLKFVIFSANISVYVHPIGPEFGLMDSFLTLNKMTEQVFENSKILQNFGIKIESRHYTYVLIRSRIQIHLTTFGKRLCSELTNFENFIE